MRFSIISTDTFTRQGVWLLDGEGGVGSVMRMVSWCGGRWKMHEHPQLLHLDIAVIYGMKLQRHVYEFGTSNVIWMTNPQEHDKEECW